MAPNTTRVVIVGAGIAGVPLAYAIKARLHGSAEVTVVSDSTHFHFVPANPWIALGLRAGRDVTFALEPLLTARKVALRVDALQELDLDARRLNLVSGRQLEYDYLVIATGIRPDWLQLPGAEGNPLVHSVILPTDATAAHAAYNRFLGRLGPAVIAAAPRVPTIGPMYEYAFLLDADLRRRALRHRVPITLITPEPYPGHVGLDKPVAREELTRALVTQGIEWIGNAALQRCAGRQLQFALYAAPEGHPGSQGKESESRSLDFEYAMIWPPFRGIEAVARCTSLCDADGLVLVDEYQRSLGHPDVFALGACTARPLLTSTPVAVGSPDAVYVIQQQVAIVADNIVHSMRDEPLIRASIERERWIADVGKRGAAHLAAPQIPLQNVQWLYQGHWVYDAKREFEEYFINQILFGAGPHGQVLALVRRLRSELKSHAISPHRTTLDPALPLSIDTRRHLEALARQLDVDPVQFSQQLLETAITETLSCLDPPISEQVRADVQAKLVDELDTQRERVRFEGGAP